jgi:predicted transcriptional regulator
MEKTTVYLPGDLAARIRELAKRRGRPAAELIRDALARYVAEQVRPSPASLGAGEDPELSARESEDWLRARWRRRR